MYIVIYVSSATELLSQEDLENLLAKARTNNHALGISGLLLYQDGNFMQILEGPKQAVQDTLRKIEVDIRHRGMIRLLQRETSEREFGEWSMGFRRLETASPAHLPGHSDFLDRPLSDEHFRQNPSHAYQLLLSFKKSVV